MDIIHWWNSVLGGQYSLHIAWGDIIHQWNNVRGGTIFGWTLYTMMENMLIFTSWTVISVHELGYDVKNDD